MGIWYEDGGEGEDARNTLCLNRDRIKWDKWGFNSKG